MSFRKRPAIASVGTRLTWSIVASLFGGTRRRSSAEREPLPTRTVSGRSIAVYVCQPPRLAPLGFKSAPASTSPSTHSCARSVGPPTLARKLTSCATPPRSPIPQYPGLAAPEPSLPPLILSICGLAPRPSRTIAKLAPPTDVQGRKSDAFGIGSARSVSSPSTVSRKCISLSSRIIGSSSSSGFHQRMPRPSVSKSPFHTWSASKPPSPPKLISVSKNKL
mmetsp:Transcript_23000/g.55078  ORF Transcript_23000/g.55078 Transcript_23000/m.55078 type:complete len:221 (+) Transcript_23000:1162-1824(+)